MQSAMETPRVAALQKGPPSGLIATLRARYDQNRTYRQTVAELSALSDRSLADLGLSRSMIRPLAREVAARG